MPKSKSKRKRRQPPPKVNPRKSDPWVGALMMTLLLAGMVILILNYVDVFPGGAANWRLFYGLGIITASFVVATRWH